MTPVAVIAVLVVVLLAVDAGLTSWVRRVAGRRLEEALGTPVAVHVRGWPATVRLPLGQLRAVVLRAEDVPVGRTRLRVLEVVLDRVRPRPRDDGAWTVASSGGSFTAWLDLDGFRALAPLPSAVVDVRLVPGRVRFELPGGVAVRASVHVEGDVVVLVPEVGRLEVLSVLRIAFPLEQMPFGASVDDVEVAEGELIVRGGVGPVELGAPSSSA